MKRIFILTISALIFLGGGVKAEGTVSLKDEAGITPDSVLYNIDTVFENISLNLAADKDKPEQLLDILNERLGEIEVLAEKDEDELVEKTLKDYNNTVEEVENTVEELEQDTKKGEKLEESIDNIQDIIVENRENSIKVLEDIKDKLPDKARKNIETVIEMQKNKKEAVKLMVEKRHEFNEAKKDYNKAKAALKEAQALGDADPIKKAEEELKSIEEVYNAKKQALNEAIENKKQIVKEKKKTNDNKKDKIVKNNGSKDKVKSNNEVKENDNTEVNQKQDNIQRNTTDTYTNL
ncbi:hypothetical protein CFK35_17385, partial [Clostridium sp. cpc1]|uniref:DUF5667 domain-containing protein n=1 Tax=Clostridium sp. cpc1 TaxID=2016536 RepID=UPI00223F4789